MALNYVYADVDISFERGRDGDLIKDIDIEAIKNSIKNILQTSKGTRRMLPYFGADLNWLLFEPIDTFTARRIGNIIYSEIMAWEYRMVIDNVNVAPDMDNYQYNITISFHIAGIGDAGFGNISFVLKQS